VGLQQEAVAQGLEDGGRGEWTAEGTLLLLMMMQRPRTTRLA
jgi:hypothetical protein